MQDLKYEKVKRKTPGRTDVNNTPLKRSVVYFSNTPQGRKRRAMWLKERGMFEFVKLVADTFHNGKLPEMPECYEALSGVSEKETTE